MSKEVFWQHHFKVDLCQKVIREKTAFEDSTPFHSSLLWRIWKGNPFVCNHIVNVNVSLIYATLITSQVIFKFHSPTSLISC